MSEPTVKYKDTEWRKAEFRRVMRYETRPDDMTCFSGICSNGEELRSNLILFPKVVIEFAKPRYFIMDEKDYDWVNIQMNDNRRPDEEEYKPVYLMSLTQFLERQNKKIYMRTIPTSYNSMSPCDRVFTDDILEIIPILLKQQGTPLKDSDNRLEKYQKEWNHDETNAYNTIDIQDFKKILEEFDINKDLITILDDIPHKLKSLELVSRTEHLVSTISPDGKDVMHPEQAVFHVFESTFCGLDWARDNCVRHENCMEQYKKKIIEVMNKYANMSKTTFITIRDVESNIQALKNDCAYTLQMKNKKPDFHFRDYTFDEVIPIDAYRCVCSVFHLPSFRNIPMDVPKDTTHISAWKARMFLTVGWIQYFMHIETDNLLIFLMNALVFRAPRAMCRTVDSIVRYIILSDHQEPPESQQLYGPLSHFLSDFAEATKRPEPTPNTVRDELKSLADIIMKGQSRTNQSPNTNTTRFDKMKEKKEQKMQKNVEKIKPKEQIDSEQANKAKAKDLVVPQKEVKQEVKTGKKVDKTGVPSNEKKEKDSKEIATKSESLVENSKNSTIAEAKETGKPKNKKKKKNKASEKPNEAKSDAQELSTLNKGPSVIKQKSVGTSTTEKSPTPEPAVNESKCCAKCLRTSEMCNEAKKELKTTQNKLKSYESKAKRTDELEKNMKEKDEEIEQLKKCLASQEKCSEETKTLRLKISENEASEGELKDSNMKLLQKNQELEEKMCCLQQKCDANQKSSIEKQNKLEKKISEKTEANARLQETNMRLSIRAEENERIIQNLLNRLASTS